jgi:hypothetical protein
VCWWAHSSRVPQARRQTRAVMGRASCRAEHDSLLLIEIDRIMNPSRTVSLESLHVKCHSEDPLDEALSCRLETGREYRRANPWSDADQIGGI